MSSLVPGGYFAQLVAQEMGLLGLEPLLYFTVPLIAVHFHQRGSSE
jgi:hypothetical protein